MKDNWLLRSRHLWHTPRCHVGVDCFFDHAHAIVPAGDTISVHYTGTLYKDGSKFDSSRDRNSPFDLTLGRRSVITGWEEGLQGMCVGERRKLIIPSGKGYGASGSPPKIHGGAFSVSAAVPRLVLGASQLDFDSSLYFSAFSQCRRNPGLRCGAAGDQELSVAVIE